MDLFTYVLLAYCLSRDRPPLSHTSAEPSWPTSLSYARIVSDQQLVLVAMGKSKISLRRPDISHDAHWHPKPNAATAFLCSIGGDFGANSAAALEAPVPWTNIWLPWITLVGLVGLCTFGPPERTETAYLP
jgi:hypothetical protein